MSDMDMRAWPGRTHRYVQVPVLYPFGHGLSYNKYSYDNLVILQSNLEDSEQGLHAAVQVTNQGDLVHLFLSTS